MKLRYLRLSAEPPLQDITINFGHDSMLDRKCAIHFLIGSNGSGKTKLLQLLTKIFLNLDPSFTNQSESVPNFHVTLAYDIGKDGNNRTIYLRRQEKSSLFIEFTKVLNKEEVEDWEFLPEQVKGAKNASKKAIEISKQYTNRDMPGKGSINYYLPSVVLAYTSGSTQPWEEIFTHHDHATLDDTKTTNGQHLQYGTDEKQNLNKEITPTSEFFGIGILVKPNDLKLAFCAVALEQSIKDIQDISTKAKKKQFVEKIQTSMEKQEKMPGLRGILNTVDWLWPITVTLHINSKHAQTDIQKNILANLLTLTKTIVKNPALQERLLFVFDLQRPINKKGKEYNTALALYKTIVGTDLPNSFDFFHQLYNWKQEGLLEDISISFRKRNVEDILFYEWLSDGEQFFLGRMALFHLLKGKDDALLLLDEPETHFNDLWKREIVDIIDESLRDTSAEILISTHSSIVLTDAFNTEISFLRKNVKDGMSQVINFSSKTFGADPSEIMINVFKAEDSIGQRALEYLNNLLERKWEQQDKKELEYLIRHIGEGYHRSELRTIWRKLNAAQN